MKKVFVALCFVLVFVSCENASMEKLVGEYNKMFVPSEDVLWTEENIKKGTKSFEEFEFPAGGFKISKDTGLFIIGGPRDCTKYIWFLDGAIINTGSTDAQLLRLRIKVSSTDFDSGEWKESFNISGGTHKLKLQCTKGITKFWETDLIIE